MSTREVKTIPVGLVTDPAAQEGFEVIRDMLVNDPLLNSNFKFIELSFRKSGTYQVAHNLGFLPLDVILTSIVPFDIQYLIHHGNFTNQTFKIQVFGPCSVRLFIGAYHKET